MSEEPCKKSAQAWPIGKMCPACRHSGWFHSGGGGGHFQHCLLCNLTYLEAALIERERELGLKIHEAEALMLHIGATAARVGFNSERAVLP